MSAERVNEGVFTMPIQDRELPGPFVWVPTEADRRQALSNHNQTLERLAQRGGMSWCEMAAIVLNKEWRAFKQDYAKAVCRDVLKNRVAFGVNVRPSTAAGDRLMTVKDLGPDQMVCPNCGSIAESDSVDIGVGIQVRGNFHCEGCEWSAEQPTDAELGLDPIGDELFS
jgi:hypothetical protein